MCLGVADRHRTAKEDSMPLVRISLREGTSPDYRKALADGVHRALIEAIAIPPGDRFQVITQHPPGDLIYSPDYLGISRSDRVVFVQITLSVGRKPQQRRALFKRMSEILAESPGLRPEDLVVNLSKFRGRTGRSAMAKPSIWIRRVCGLLSFAPPLPF
jgi:phenylpyruvate tautomerase PptA (4-oxalocrotonate tautomerase family)